MEIYQALKKGKEILKKAGIKDYNIEAEIILSNLLDIERYQLWTEKIHISKKNEKCFFSLIKKRTNFIPLAYLIRHIYFWKYKFSIKSGVFIPRPETELIIETAKQIFYSKTSLKILDICTGCGILAVCLAKEFQKSVVIATDISKRAIDIAKINAGNIGVSSQVKFFQCNLFLPNENVYDIIVSNPPYISEIDMKNLQKEVQYEPKRALYGGKYGFDYYVKIIEYSKKFLKKNGYLIMEISPEQKEFFMDTDFAPLKTIEIKKDFCGLERVVIVRMC